jgi:EAL domain-containing protein (putative c-di-GMP-specific phosphodiesterase class I)
MPIDIIKLDRTLTAALDAPGGRGTGLVRAILGLGAGLGLPTVGCGVDTSGQADLLRELACPMAQGRQFAVASPADQVTAYLSQSAGVSAAH